MVLQGSDADQPIPLNPSISLETEHPLLKQSPEDAEKTTEFACLPDSNKLNKSPHNSKLNYDTSSVIRLNCKVTMHCGFESLWFT